MTPEEFLALGKSIYKSTNARQPPDDGILSESHQVIPPAVVRGTRGYIEKITNQINGCYEKGWFDAAAVLMRRLLETLIIESFEHHQISNDVKNANGDFKFLRDLINATLRETRWTLSRNTRSSLPGLKDLGDKSAHSRRYVAHRQDIDSLKTGFRGVVQELVFLSGLK